MDLQLRGRRAAPTGATAGTRPAELTAGSATTTGAPGRGAGSVLRSMV